MASFVSNNWKGHLGISVSELCFKNAPGLLINNRSNFWEERIIIRKIAQIKTIGVTKMGGDFIEILFQAKFL